jgi:hypothetical protein
MRWLVEVSSLGKTDQQKFCVEAESWQRALQAARAQRGEEGPMSGFSIELLEEGYRAVDPLTRVRFIVKRAPDDMPITAPVPKETKGGMAPSKPSSSKSSSIAPPTAEKSDAKAPPAPESSASALGKKSVPPRPATSTDKSNGAAAQRKGGASSEAAAKDKKPSIAPPAASADVPPAPLLPIGAPIPGLPNVKVLSSREQDPTDVSPLTYREYSFAVPPGTTEEVAADVLKGQLRIVDSHIQGARMGKLVNLAAFDVEFTGKPPVPPLATLTWKDWKGEPVIGYPRRGGAQKLIKPPSGDKLSAAPASTAVPSSGPVPPPPSMPVAGSPRPGAPSAAAATTAAAPAAPASAPAEAAPTAPKAPAAPASSPPPPAAAATPAAASASPAAPSAPAAPAAPASAPATANPFTSPAPAGQNPFEPTPANPFAATAPMIPPSALPQSSPAAAKPAAPASIPPPAPAAPASIPVPVMAPVTTFTPGSVPLAAPAPVPPPAPASAPVAPPAPASASVPPPAAAQPATTSQPPPRRSSVPDGMVRTPSGRFVRGRTTGDELITALFESMHDLHFLRDALDGGQFCLALATEVLPSRAALIHFFDVEKREWVVACTRGKDTAKLLTMRTPESDEPLRAAARKRRAIVTPDATVLTNERYQMLGGCRSLIIAPIMQAGRALGAMEIINPLDGMPFNEDEGNAMTYIAEQYAEYLGSRGIVLDNRRIQAAAAPR